MKIVGLLPVRNEDWCLGLTLRALLMWVDEVVVCLHACTDETERIIIDCAGESKSEHYVNGRVWYFKVNEDCWDEMRQRQQLLEVARGWNATHVVILDADEILSGNLLPTIWRTIEAIPAGRILQLPGYNLRGGIERYHANGIWGNRWFSTAFRDDPRLGWVGDRFHQREPQGAPLVRYSPIAQGAGGIMHLWASSERRLIEKHRLYKCVERIRWPKKTVAEIDKMYSLATEGTGPADCPNTWKYSTTPASWWEPYSQLIKHLNIDSIPWQTVEIERLLSVYGVEYFKGLRI